MPKVKKKKSWVAPEEVFAHVARLSLNSRGGILTYPPTVAPERPGLIADNRPRVFLEQNVLERVHGAEP